MGKSFGWIWDAKPTPELHQFAESISARLRTNAGPWLSEADVVISAVFGSAAYEVAANALQHMRTGAMFVDMTTADPQRYGESRRAF